MIQGESRNLSTDFRFPLNHIIPKTIGFWSMKSSQWRVPYRKHSLREISYRIQMKSGFVLTLENMEYLSRVSENKPKIKQFPQELFAFSSLFSPKNPSFLDFKWAKLQILLRKLWNLVSFKAEPNPKFLWVLVRVDFSPPKNLRVFGMIKLKTQIILVWIIWFSLYHRLPFKIYTYFAG